MNVKDLPKSELTDSINDNIVLIMQEAAIVGVHYTIAPAILAGIACHESGFGRYPSGRNNYTGMKHVPGMWKTKSTCRTTEIMHDADNPTGPESSILCGADFVNYISLQACLLHLAETFCFSNFYKPCREHGGLGSFNHFNALVEADLLPILQMIGKVYATDPIWADGVMNCIQRASTIYDKLILSRTVVTHQEPKE